MRNFASAAIACATDRSGAAGGELAILAAFFAFGFLVVVNLLGTKVTNTLSQLSGSMPSLLN
jgi:Flp pilus assembly pilin Flp